MNDLKSVVANTYLHIIGGTLKRISFFESDTIINNLLRLHIKEPELADEKLIITAKFYIYRNFWQAILETLYEKYLPNVSYAFSWEIEITPYTLMLCELTKGHFESTEIELQKKIMKISDEEIESDFDRVLIDTGLPDIGFKDGIKNKIANEFLPSSKKEQLILLFRLMNFPPLNELALFQLRYNSNLHQQITNLSIAFSGIDTKQIPDFGMPESLHYSYFPIDHSTFKKYGLDGFASHPSLSDYKSDFDKIRALAKENKNKFKDFIICPCCGERQEIELPEEIMQYKYLLENLELCKKIGFIYHNDFVENYKNVFSERIQSFLPELNKVDNPDCLVLVEGESEESSIPILAFRKRFILSQHKIQVYNSKSKEKLAADFLSFRNNFPNLKIICLLDSDAKKESADIQRIVDKHRDKYRLVVINKGTFEDIFDLDLSVEILNEIYREGELIVKTDFNTSKSFLYNIKKFLFKKKKARFDKVLFAKAISFKLDMEKLPKEIEEIFQVAEDFTKPANFIKQ